MSKTDRKKLGDKYEDQTASYLIASGYKILEQNWRWKRAEIDIIAMKDGVMIFVEVKSRSYDYYGDAALAVDSNQQNRLADAATAYMIERQYEGELRFDIVSFVKQKTGEWKMEHYEDAFFPSDS